MGQHKRPRATAQMRRAILARFAESGLSVEAFCRRESISPSSFYRWRSLQRDPVPRELALPRVPSSSGDTGTFVSLGSLQTASASFELRLDLGGGVFLQLVRG
jgi:transposase-like protein